MSQTQSSLTTLEGAASDLAAALKLPVPRGQSEREALTLAAQWAMQAPDLQGIPVASEKWLIENDQLKALLDAGSTLASIHSEFDQALTTDAWDHDLLAVRQILGSQGSKWWRRVSSDYRRAEKQLTGMMLQPRPPGLERRIQLVDAVIEAQRQRAVIAHHQSLGEELFAHRWQDQASDWEALSLLTSWLQQLHREVESGKVPGGLIDLLAENPPLEPMGALLRAVEDAAQTHAATATVIRDGLEAARRELLDLGLRNPLLNYRLLRTRGLEAVDELPDQVYRILVDEGRTMSFLPISDDEPDGNLGQPEEGEEHDELAARHTDARLQTALPSPELQTRLLSTYHLANSFIQEQGVNTLFLALGMLTWYESEDSQEARRAPLLMIPVALERSNVRERFGLRHTGEDPGENLSLKEKTRSQFGVTLPATPDAEDLKITGYFASIQEAIKTLPSWSVQQDSIVLGFFSFNKFSMYRDLDADIWPDSANPTEHPIIGALLHEGFDEPAPTISSDDQLDQHLAPGAMHQVLDADGSQTLALVDVNDGRNLVVQGPPGTGKSQTITNMIAEAMGQGRTVLFVSEKMAALEVVKRRLDSVGLGDACLELHSHKATKKAVLEELRHTLELDRPRLGQMDTDLDNLERLRDRLNSYCEAVNGPVGDSGVSPYLAYGELAVLEQRTGSLELPKLDIPEIASWPETEFSRKEEIVQELQIRLSAMGVPQNHPFWGSRLRVLLPAEQEHLRRVVTSAQSSLTTLDEAAVNLANSMGLSRSAGQRESMGLCVAARKAMEAPDLTGVKLRSEDWRTRQEELSSLLEAGSRLAEIQEQYGQILNPVAWDQDLDLLKETLDTRGQQWWRLLSGEYRRAKIQLANLCIDSPPAGIDAQLRLVDAVIESHGLRTTVDQGHPLGEKLFGPRWQGADSDWTAFSSLAHWLWQLYADVAASRVPDGIIDYLAQDSLAIDLGPLVKAVEDAQQQHSRNVNTAVEIVDLDLEGRFGSQSSLGDQSFEVQRDVIDAWSIRLNDIQEIISLNNISDTCTSESLGPLIGVAETWPPAANHLLDALRKAWFEALVTRALAEREALASFDGGSQQQAVERFREMDSLMLRHSRARLAQTHWEGLPRHGAAGQLGVLLRQFQIRRRHLPIRQLMAQAGNAVQAIKPVFMMSPLSIATYIPPGSFKFDLVIFDEASQVRPMDAFGAIMRSGQAVVVGDEKQLPPSRFFDSVTQGTDEDEETAISNIESLLGLFASKNAPGRMLRWHYRSRHESLIAVSNREFYDNRLVVFPSPDGGRKESGLRLHHLPDTIYERGRSRTNPVEAEAVARAVMEHAQLHPDLTLGVAAFSTAQMQSILDRLELLRREDPSHEGFFASHPHEPFFVKNLETVQGDERDVILISVGYGRDGSGRVDMNFGPLNWDGGERRLNVLITRARLRCEVFTNLVAGDFPPGRTASLGLHALKEFLAYAASEDQADQQGTSGDPVPPFQQAVAQTLTGMGHELRHQPTAWGNSVDLTLVDPEQPGRYLLGIEFDGPTYHSSRSARDRDRLRHQVLASLGWRTHRIWSTEWFRNPDKELQRVVQAIQHAKNEKVSKAPQAPLVPVVERNEAVPTNSTADNIPAYRLANPKISVQGPEFNTASDTAVALWVADVVEAESPVHTDEVARRIAVSAGARRNKRFQEVVDRAIQDATASGRLRRQDAFLWWNDMEAPTLRDRSGLPAASRKIELVAPEELAVAVLQAVAASYGIDRKDVPVAAARLLGFARVTTEMRSTFEPVVRRMITEGKLVQQGDQVVIADRPKD